MRDRRVAEAQGRAGERWAAWYLRLKGWRILDRRVRTKAGEIDLVVRRGSIVAFVEVKARGTAAALDLAIDERRLRRVAAAAEMLAPR
jgi:putative endonuclease